MRRRTGSRGRKLFAYSVFAGPRSPTRRGSFLLVPCFSICGRDRWGVWTGFGGGVRFPVGFAPKVNDVHRLKQLQVGKVSAPKQVFPKRELARASFYANSSHKRR